MSLGGAQSQPAKPKDQFARTHGFAFYLDLFESSTRAGTVEGRNWFVTGVPSGNWIVWNDVELIAQTRNSAKEARAQLPETLRESD